MFEGQKGHTSSSSSQNEKCSFFSAIDELYDVRYFLLCIVFFAGMLGLTSNEGFLVSSCDDELWPVILTFELDPESTKMNQISRSGVI